MRTRAEIVADIRALAAEVQELDGDGSIVPGSLEHFADLVAEGPVDHVALIRALLDEGSWLS
jgi:hypothetical protein